MPELPEVETIARSLAPLLTGRRVRRLTLRATRLRKPLDSSLAEAVYGRRIEEVGRRGKYLLLHLDDGFTWIWHMGMSGCLVHQRLGETQAARKHDHVIAELDDGGRLVFNDPRRFGLSLVDRMATCGLFSAMGPELLDVQAFNGPYLASWRRRTGRNIKDVLMDQRVVAGLGNIYASEILFVCGLRPTRRLARMSRAACDAVVVAAREIISEAIEHRGTSVSDFLDGIGKPGGYQWRLRVYGRRGQACPRCGSAIKSVLISQRSSFYCPRCQK